MKRKLLTIAAVVAVMTLINFKANAQNAATGTTNAIIKIVDSYAILVKDANVQIDYLTQPDFVDDRSVEKSGHITVFSNRKYKVDVKAADAFKDPLVPSSSIASNVMKVTVTTPAAAPANTTYTAQSLTQSNTNIIDLAPAAFLMTYGITYSIPLVSNILGTPSGTYATVVTYTLTQQ